MFLDGLPEGLAKSIITFTNPLPQNWDKWVRAAQLAQQKYLYLRSRFSKGEKGESWKNKKHTQQQWKQAFAKQDPNAMDTTPGRVKARATITDEERTKLLVEGRCFRCKEKGHLSRACPQKTSGSGSKVRQGETDDALDTTIKATGAPKLSTKELFTAITNLGDEDKDKLIQEAFMGKDF